MKRQFSQRGSKMIIIDNIEQGTPEWFNLRLGIPTASNFKRIITSTGKAVSSTVSETFRNELLTQRITGKSEDNYQSEWMKRGNELEAEAFDYYHLLTQEPVKKVGFVYKDDGRLIGCSPDGLGENGGLEIKCPKGSTQVKYLLKNKCPSEYFPQVQGSIWVCDKDYWDFVSYHPDMQFFKIRVHRDDGFIKKLEYLAAEFIDKLLDSEKILKEDLK